MKSDREFLDGIYEKAKIIEQSEPYSMTLKRPGFNKGYRYLRPVFMSILLLFVVYAGAVKYQNINTKPGNETLNEDMNPDVRSISLMQTQPMIITGRVIKLQPSVDKNDLSYATILIDKVIQGTAKSKEKLEVEYYQEDDNGMVEFEEDEKVLLFLLDLDEKLKIIEDGSLGKYSLVSEENGEEIYKAYDGTIINSRDLLN